jgi:hypothetical protein
MTVSPGCTCAELTAAPHPVVTPQPTRHALSNGMSSGIFTAETVEIVVVSQNADRPTI